MGTAFVIHPDDNVATLLDDADGLTALRGATSQTEISSTTAIGLGHKIALSTIAEGSPVIKFGVRIGLARLAIAAGDWVHLHNVESQFDERSGKFDPITGAAQDTTYA